MRTQHAWWRRLSLLLLALAALSGRSSRADDDDPSAVWLTQAPYEDLGSVEAGPATRFRVWHRSGPPEVEGAEVPELALLRAEEGVIVEAYDVERETVTEGVVRLTVRRRTAADETLGSRIAEFPDGPGPLDLRGAGRLAQELLDVEPRWQAAAQRLAAALAAQRESEEESARGLLRDAVRALERARQAAPWHLGIVADLLAAYQLLLPYEVGTDRGANVSFLWREVCRQWEDGVLTEDEQALSASCQLSCAFAEGCYPLAARLLEHPLLSGRDDLQPVRGALVALGQAQSESGERVRVAGPRGSLDLLTLACPAEPRSASLPWHRRVYLTYPPDDEGPPLPVWFSLSLEGESSARRWALVGWVGGSRRLLRLYGRTEPAAAEVDTFVTGLVQQSADAEGVR